MRVLVCGSRTFTRTNIIYTMLDGLYMRYGNDLVVIEGAAPGADTAAEQWAVSCLPEDNHLRFPADWDRYGKAAGPIRNKQMLVEGMPDEVWAFVDKPLNDSRGTANMVGQAEEWDDNMTIVVIQVDDPS